MSVDETKCPSCGRFVGAYEKCPYCGASVSKRLSIKLFRYGSLIFSVLGLAILYFISAHKEIPLIKINQISPTMNFAYIRVKGIVTRYPVFDEKLSILTVQINDGTEDLMVKAYRVTALKIKKLNKIPEIGQIIDLEGTVRIRGSLKILTINVPERIKIIDVPFKPVKLAEISDSFINKRVSVSGSVADVRYYKNYVSLFISDIKGKNKTKIPLNLNYIGKNIPELDVGYKIKIQGIVSYYGGHYNIVPVSAKSIRIVSTKPFIPEYKISDISGDILDRVIKTKGTITKLRQFSKGVSLTIDDNDNFIDVVLWNDVYRKVPNKSELKENAVISVTGKVGIYRGKLQIVPLLAKNVKIVKKAERIIEETVEEPEEIIEPVDIASITTNQLGKIVKIKGDIISYYDFSKGRNLTLKDKTGSIKVILWNNVLDHIPEAEYLVSGATIAVKGKLDEYRGELEIIPKYSDDVEIIKIPLLEETSEETESVIEDRTNEGFTNQSKLSNTIITN